jgi:hypothetical protein
MLYKKFLIGSRVLEKVKVTNYDQLKTLAEVALEYPESLQQLRQVFIFYLFSHHKLCKVSKSARIIMKYSSIL